MPKIINLPLTEKDIAGLKAGDNVLLNGVLYVARDAAHKKIVEALDKGKNLLLRLKDRRFITWVLRPLNQDMSLVQPVRLQVTAWIFIHYPYWKQV